MITLLLKADDAGADDEEKKHLEEGIGMVGNAGVRSLVEESLREQWAEAVTMAI